MSIESPSRRPFAAVRSQEGTTSLSITVVVPVRNEAAFIERTLRQLASQDYDPLRFEVLVIDGQSTDNTPRLAADVARHYPNVRLLSNPKRLSSAGRNIGIRHARGDIVLVVDGHCDFEDDQYLNKLSAAFRRSGADCVGRPQPLDVAGASPLQRAIAAARASRLGHHPDSYVYSATEGFVPAKSVAVAYRRQVFDKVGLFDERFDACEDVELNHRIDRAALCCFLTPQVAIHYIPRTTLGGLFRQMLRYGRGRVRLARKHPETLSWRTFAPAMWLSGIVAGLGLSWLSLWLATTYLIAVAIYLGVVLAAAAKITVSRRDILLLPRLPLVYFAIHAGYGAGLMLEGLKGGRR